MKEKLKYFILNNAYGFEQGTYENMEVDGNKLRFCQGRKPGISCFMTKAFDSLERGNTWHRLVINTENCLDDELRIIVYASDDKELVFKGEPYMIDDVISAEEIKMSEKKAMLSPFEKKLIGGAHDILLHDVSGRYLWVYVELLISSDTPAVINDIRLYLPAESWIDRLPDIYRKSDAGSGFLERYLAIFQTLYEEVEYDIDCIADRFDPESAESGFLEWLAQWLDIADHSMWTEDKFRKFMMSAVSLYRSRGTRESLSRVIELYTGEKPFIIENAELLKYRGTENYENTLVPLYGKDPYKVYILVSNDVIHSDSDIDVLWQIAREFMPMTVSFEVRVLEPYLFLGQNSYLGINSSLSQPNNAVLDGKSRLTLSVLGEQNNNKE